MLYISQRSVSFYENVWNKIFLLTYTLFTIAIFWKQKSNFLLRFQTNISIYLVCLIFSEIGNFTLNNGCLVGN